MKKNKIIAVDFDGTLCENKYPDFGAPRTDVIERLLQEQRAGARVILWTCRSGEDLLMAIYWALDKGIAFDAVNANLNSTIEHFGGETRKVCADEYWDDKAVLPFEREKDGAFRVDTLQKNKNVSRETKQRGFKTMDFLTELTEQAETVFNELIAAKREAKAATSETAKAYNLGRAEELEKWWESLEEMILKTIERRASERKEQIKKGATNGGLD